MTESIPLSFGRESLDAKAKWFRTLSIQERMDVLIAFTNMILKNNPDIVNQDVRPALEDVRIFGATPGKLDNED